MLPLHDRQMIPELAAVFVGVAGGREEYLHGIYDGGCAQIALVTVFDGRAVVDHVLYVAPVFG